MATFQDLQNSVSYYLDDLQFGYFTPTQVQLWLNNAQLALQWRLLKAAQNFYTRKIQTTLIPNQQEYVLPQDFMKLHRLEVVIYGTAPNEYSQPLSPITTNQQDLIGTGSGVPQWYTFKRNRLVIRPAPQTALQLRMDYSYQAAAMILPTDVPDVPDDYVQYLPVLAAEDGFIKDGRPSDLLNKRMAELERKIDSDAQERNQDQSRSIVETGTFSGSDMTW